MSVLNDDGYPMDLTSVFVFFMMPNFTLLFLTTLIAYLLHLSKKHPSLKLQLGRLANCFAKGALDRIIRNILRNLEMEKQHAADSQSPGAQQGNWCWCETLPVLVVRFVPHLLSAEIRIREKTRRQLSVSHSVSNRFASDRFRLQNLNARSLRGNVSIVLNHLPQPADAGRLLAEEYQPQCLELEREYQFVSVLCESNDHLHQL